MGAALLEDQEIAQLCDRCAQAAGIDLRALLTTTPDDELRLTQNAQPALYFTGVALARILRRHGIEPAATAGHSVGEYAALTAAGAIEPEAGIRAVVERGRAMAEAVPAGTSSMIAVLGLAPEKVEAALIGIQDAWPANYNTPTQVVLGGTRLGLERAGERLRQSGARRVIPLNVSAAFHTMLMEPAADRLRSTLDTLAWQEPAVPVIANLTGAAYAGARYVPQTLEKQLSSPVLWSTCVGTLVEMGCDTFIEVGPGRALTGMMKELAPSAAAHAVGTPESVAGLAAAG
jgi:[acyl-carrier-protein] S-malonyltransferase